MWVALSAPAPGTIFISSDLPPTLVGKLNLYSYILHSFIVIDFRSKFISALDAQENILKLLCGRKKGTSVLDMVLCSVRCFRHEPIIHASFPRI